MNFKKHKLVEVRLDNKVFFPTTEKLIEKAQKEMDEWIEKGWEVISVSIGTTYMTTPMVLITLSFDEEKVLNTKV